MYRTWRSFHMTLTKLDKNFVLAFRHVGQLPLKQRQPQVPNAFKKAKIVDIEPNETPINKKNQKIFVPDNKTRKKKTKTKENVDSVLNTFKTTIKRVYQITQ